MVNVRFELTHGGYIRENNIRDLERLVELGLVGIEDLTKQAVDFVSNEFFGRVRVEYYAGHIIYGENYGKILDARRQVLNQYGHAKPDFPTLDRVISKVYGVHSYPINTAIGALFAEEFNKITSNLQALHRELLDENVRVMASDIHVERMRNLMMPPYEPQYFFTNTDPIV